jgi:hypothetical protein
MNIKVWKHTYHKHQDNQNYNVSIRQGQRYQEHPLRALVQLRSAQEYISQPK